MVHHGQHDQPAREPIDSDLRRTLLIGRREELDRHLAGVRSSLIDAVINGLLIVALIGVPASLMRASRTGWLPLYSVHIALGITVLILFASRSVLTDRVKAGAIIAIFWAVGLSSLWSLGLAGTGIWWLVISSLLVSLLYTIRAGLLVMCLALLAISAAAIAFCLGYLPLPPGTDNFLRSPSAWISAVLGATLMPLLVFRAVAALNTGTVTLLRETGDQREQIRELAAHDDLTGVPTLTLALDRLEQSLRAIPRSSRFVGVLFIDLDGFKAINDSLGHEAGDSVLTMVARRLRLNLRVEDTVARIGGDEFLVILTGVLDADALLAVAGKLQRLIAEPLMYRDLEVVVGSSFGAAFASDNSRSAEDMIRVADSAMYEAKRAGRNQVRIAPPPQEPLPDGQ